jgi:hypothetical protein
MDNSTLVLTAALEIHRDMLVDEAFAGYSGDLDQMQTLIDELWDLQFHSTAGLVPSVVKLVEAWYDKQAEIFGEVV